MEASAPQRRSKCDRLTKLNVIADARCSSFKRSGFVGFVGLDGHRGPGHTLTGYLHVIAVSHAVNARQGLIERGPGVHEPSPASITFVCGSRVVYPLYPLTCTRSRPLPSKSNTEKTNSDSVTSPFVSLSSKLKRRSTDRPACTEILPNIPLHPLNWLRDDGGSVMLPTARTTRSNGAPLK